VFERVCVSGGEFTDLEIVLAAARVVDQQATMNFFGEDGGSLFFASVRSLLTAAGLYVSRKLEFDL
jgi:hypothetical protein